MRRELAPSSPTGRETQPSGHGQARHPTLQISGDKDDMKQDCHNLYFGNCCLFEPGISGDKIGDRCILNLKPHVVVFTDQNVPAQFSIHTSTLFSVLDKTSIFLDLNSQRHVFPQKSSQYFLFQVWD